MSTQFALNPLRYSKILIVDDSEFFRVSIKKTLKEAQIGSRYFEAKDGKEAISQYVHHKPNVVIMDIMMPNVDGVKATQVIKKYDPNAKIIIISSKESKETIDDTINSGGAKDYVLKPLDSSQVVMAVSKQLSLNQKSSGLNKEQELSDKNNDLLSTETQKMFDESLFAIDDFEKKRMDILRDQLTSEKKLSQELNDKLHRNLSKIAKAELEIIKKKAKLEDELDQKTKQLIKSERFAAIGELSSRLSHDMRNPLSVIQLSLENLKMSIEMDDSQHHQFDRISRAVDRIVHQVEGVLDYVREMPLKKETVSLRKIIQNSFKNIDINSNITLVQHNNDCNYKCDSEKMEIAFGNLFLNSIQAIGDEQGQINTKIEETTDSVIISIQDSGKGISEKNLVSVFDPLFTTKQTGTGLGLVSVRSIIEAHNGTISVTSPPTVFTITLPKSQ